jgi:hypothetical protein
VAANPLSGLIAFIGIFAIAFIFACVAWTIVFAIYLIFFKKEKRTDDFYVLYLQWIGEAIINVPPNMRELWRLPLPSLIDFKNYLSTVKKAGQETLILNLEGYYQRLEGIRGVGIPLGIINGYVVFDLLASKEDMLLKTADDIRRAEMIAREDPAHEKHLKELVKARESMDKSFSDLIDEVGNRLHFFVFSRPQSGLVAWLLSTLLRRRPPLLTLFLFDDQVTGLTSWDGRVIALGEGTMPLSQWFSILTGYPTRYQLMVSHLSNFSHYHHILRMESAMGTYVDRASGLDSFFLKSLEMERVKAQSREKKDVSGGTTQTGEAASK